MKYFIVLVLSSVSLLACSSNEADQDKDLKLPSASVTTSGDLPQPASGGTAGVEVAGLTKTNTAAVSMPQLNTGAVAAGSIGNGALNPEHGQPGHRCEFAVGAPLNSSPTQPTVKQPTATITPTTINGTAPVKSVNVPAKSLSSGSPNPAHGQPGHRCDIAVGAALNSTATTSAKPTSTTALPTVTSSTPSLPAVQAPINAVNATGAKLNPAHGQPGHDCKIAVGQPLN